MAALRSLRFKLFGLFLAALASGATYLSFYCMPQADKASEQMLADFTARHLATVVVGLTQPLLENDLASAYETLAALQADNPDWAAVSLHDRSDRKLYPLGSLPVPTGQHLHTFEQILAFRDEYLGRITVTADMARQMAELDRIHERLAFALGGGFAAIMLAVVLMIEIGVRRPTQQLAGAANRLAQGDFEAALPVKCGGEIGSLVASFAAMRDRIKRDRDALDRARDDLEERVQQRTAELRESEERYRTFAMMLPDGVFVQTDGKIVFANSEEARLCAVPDASDLIGREALGFLHPEDRAQALYRRHQAFAGARPRRTELRLLQPDGSIVPVEATSAAIAWQGEPSTIVVHRDISDRKRAEAERARLEQQLRRAQKMESLGTLAGGVAHEFNNILVPIMGLTELSLRDVPEGSTCHRNLTLVLESATRAANVIEKILSFSRAEEGDRKPVFPGKVVQDAAELLRATLPTTARLIVEIADDAAPVNADETQLHQVLVNLAKNAADALERRPGKIVIRVENVDEPQPRPLSHAELPAGRYVRASVADTGHGISPAVMHRIFEPFFTTKLVGEGTGLGLAVVHGIVVGHGGAIDVASAPGSGTTFAIYLPVADAAPVSERAARIRSA
jgi:PAS domain S-box-containing protein